MAGFAGTLMQVLCRYTVSVRWPRDTTRVLSGHGICRLELLGEVSFNALLLLLLLALLLLLLQFGHCAQAPCTIRTDAAGRAEHRYNAAVRTKAARAKT